ncbi:nucleoside deaminase [soil metagenome]
MTYEAIMRLAIEKAREGIAQGQIPVAAVLVRADKVIAVTHNTVWRSCDPTAHAEMNCIRQACLTIRDISLRGCHLFTTLEPCPMCLAASHWSKIDRIVYGAAIADAARAGFSELEVPAAQLAALGHNSLTVESGLLREECAGLFAEWKQAGLSQAY